MCVFKLGLDERGYATKLGPVGDSVPLPDPPPRSLRSLGREVFILVWGRWILVGRCGDRL